MAKGEADIAIGTDTAGSGRVPAGLQGIVGIKPTVGVISTDGVVRASESYDCVTIFAPLLEPANRAMAVMAAGASGRAWPADVRLAAPPNPVVAVPSELPELDRDWRAAFDAAVDVLVEAGARIVTVDMEPFLAAAKLLYDGALVGERYAAVGEFIDAHPDASFDPTVRRIISAARDIPAHRLVRGGLARSRRHRGTGCRRYRRRRPSRPSPGCPTVPRARRSSDTGGSCPRGAGTVPRRLAGADATRQGRIRRRHMANRVRLRRVGRHRRRHQRVRQLAGRHRSGRGLARRRVLAYVTVSRPQRAVTQHSTADGSSR